LAPQTQTRDRWGTDRERKRVRREKREEEREERANSTAYNYFISAANVALSMNRHAKPHDSLGDANFQCLGVVEKSKRKRERKQSKWRTVVCVCVCVWR